jgi:ammonium transporter, Amt family
VKYDTFAMLNGVIGGIAPFLYVPTCRLLTKLGIDDAAEAFPIHGPCGAWGILATAIFARAELTGTAYYGVIDGNNGR